MTNYLELLYLISFTGILAVAYSYLLSGQIITSSPGNARMQEIAEAIQINFLASHDFVSALEALNKEKTYFVYCRSGNRSAQACNYMTTKGFKTYNLMNGIMGWDGEVISN